MSEALTKVSTKTSAEGRRVARINGVGSEWQRCQKKACYFQGVSLNRLNPNLGCDFQSDMTAKSLGQSNS